MSNELFQIKFNSKTPQPNSAALIRCLRNKTQDLELFKSWFLKEVPTSLPNFDNAIQQRLDCVIRCRNILDKYFKDFDGEDRSLCIKYLARLISAKYSGKSQSYLSNSVDNLGAIDLTLDRIAYSIKNKKNLIFLFCFGGYKNHNCITYPEVDWAEFFHLKFFIEYLLPIISDYKYGCLIQYESEDVIIERNNVPRDALDKYSNSFLKLIEYLKKLVFEQHGIELNLELIRCRDQYDVSKLFEKMEEKREGIISVFNNLSKDEQEKWLKRADNNYMWEGGAMAHTQLASEEKRQIVFDARINNECFLEADYELRGETFFDRPNCIPFVGTWGYTPSASIIDLWFHLKSIYSSSVDFWIGTGVLSFDNGKYTERIISPSQYKAIEAQLVDKRVDEPNLLEVSNNFSKIKVFYGKFPY